MNAPVFVIEDNVAIPARTLPSAGPRESMYPIDQLKEGQGFAISLSDAKDGDFAKLGRQKQSQFSSLAKTRGIKLTTRVFLSDSPFASVPAPCLGVWHAGKAEPKTEKAEAEAAATDTAQVTEAAAEEVLEL